MSTLKPETSTLGAVEPTSRGFERIDFKDHYGIECSLQASSLAIYAKPGTSAVWLGCNDANPRVLVPGEGWQPVKMPADYLADTRMHLNREQVAALIAHLQGWLDALYRSEQDPDAPVVRPGWLRGPWQRYHRALADEWNANPNDEWTQ